MKNRIGVVVLVLLALGLGIALVVSKKKATDQQTKDAATIDGLSQKWTSTADELEKQKQVNAMYERDMVEQKKAFNEVSNKLVEVSANFSQVTDKLAKTETTLKDEMSKRDARIAGLETQNQEWEKKATDLGNDITNLNTLITSTQRKLDASEGDKAFLQKELKRLLAEKSELERQFNDLGVLRAQVSKLKQELTIARRIEWIRQGLFANSEQKGAQKLMQGVSVPAVQQARAPKPTYDLNVEVSADGSVKVIPPLGGRPEATKLAPGEMTPGDQLIDSHGRVLRDLRVSLTDRCNFRCLYCLPESEAAHNFYRGHWAHLPNSTPIVQQWVPKANLLTFEEIERVVSLAVRLGIQKIRLTGGEPLLRHSLEELVARVARIPGLADLAMTTNGFLFPQKAASLRQAGLHRLSFSLDSLDRGNFKKITGRDGLAEVLESIKLARQLGFHPVKVNAVVIRGLNDHEIEPLANFARANNLTLRFIEFMPLDSRRAWLKEMVMPSREILARLSVKFDLRPMAPEHPSATARRWAFATGGGEIGLIAPVSEPFCGHCNRLRLTADGKIRTCLFSVVEHDLRPLLRQGASDDDLHEWLKKVVWQKEARHHIGESDFVPPSRSMSCIGG